MKLNKTDEAVIAALKPFGTEATMQEIADKSGIPAKKVFRSLRKLFESEMVDARGRKYRLITEKVPVKTAEDEATDEE